MTRESCVLTSIRRTVMHESLFVLTIAGEVASKENAERTQFSNWSTWVSYSTNLTWLSDIGKRSWRAAVVNGAKKANYGSWYEDIWWQTKNWALIPAPISSLMSIDSAVLLECLIGTLAWFDDSERCTANEPPGNRVSENSKTLRIIQPGFSSLMNISQFCASIFGTTLI